MSWKKYIYAFIITLFIFFTAMYISNYFNTNKLEQIKATENKLSIDILATETEFALLGEAPCTEIEKSTLSKELGELGNKLSFLENTASDNGTEFDTMKKYYSVLEIKDFLLTKKIGSKCKNAPVSVLYFYTNDCSNCTKIGYALTTLHNKYPQLRVYSFDKKLDLSVVNTLGEIYEIGDKVPAVVINEKLITEINSIEDLEKALPKSIRDTASSTATTTKK